MEPARGGILTRPNPLTLPSRARRRGRRATRFPDLYDIRRWDVVDVVDRLARERGSTMAEVALAWVLSRPGVVAPIIGATKVDHLDSAVRALEVRLTAAEHAALEAPYRPHAVRGET